QVIGALSPELSFIYRPILTNKAYPHFSSPYLLDSADGYESKIMQPESKDGKFHITPLPIQLTGLFNSHLPDNWGHGGILPAKGLQTLLSAGVFLKWGVLSMQLNPQFHYAQNLSFDEYPRNAPEAYFTYMRRSIVHIDQPVRFGQDP